MTGIPAARFGDTVSHTDAGFGFDCGGLLGLAAGALLVGATIATGGAALAVVAAVGGAVALTGGGALAGMNIGSTYGQVEGDITTGSPNVIINTLLAARTLADIAICHDHDGPQQIATGSTSVFFNRMPAARLGDQTVCDARISSASPNVIIGGGTAQYAAISAEVSPLAVTVARDMAIGGAAVALGAGAGAAFLAAGWAGVGVFGLQAGAGIAGSVAGGLVGGAIGGAIDPVHGAAWGQAGGSLLGGIGGAGAMRGVAGAGGAADDDLFQPKAIGQTEPGAVPPNADLQAQMDAAASRGGMSAPGYPDLPANAAQTFGADPVPWDGDDPANGGSMSRVIGSADSDNGSFWSPGDPPQTEADWRGGSAVKNDWNGNGATVQSPTAGLKGWTGPAAPQPSSDGTNVLPGGNQQIWLPPGSASPSAPVPSPWR
jgi:uncharacterized Zn-binding protein involved in type VI secretion